MNEPDLSQVVATSDSAFAILCDLLRQFGVHVQLADAHGYPGGEARDTPHAKGSGHAPINVLGTCVGGVEVRGRCTPPAPQEIARCAAALLERDIHRGSEIADAFDQIEAQTLEAVMISNIESILSNRQLLSDLYFANLLGDAANDETCVPARPSSTRAVARERVPCLSI